MIFRYNVFFVLLTFLISIQTTQAQINYIQEIDSLQTLLPELSGEQKVNVLIQLSKNYGNSNQIPEASSYAQQAFELAQQINYPDGIAGSYSLFATLKILEEKPDEAMEYFDKALKIFEQTQNQEGVIEVKAKLAVFYFYYNENIDLGIQYLEEAIDYYDKTQNLYLKSQYLGDLGLIYEKIQEYDKALECYEQAVSLAQKIKTFDYQAAVLYNIAKIYGEKDDIEQAKNYLLEALAIRETIENTDPLIIATLNSDLGEVYAILENYLLAKNHFLKAKKIYEQKATEQQSPQYLFILSSLVDVHYYLNEIPNCIDITKESIEIYKKINDIQQLSSLTANLGILYEMMDDLSNSLSFFEQSLEYKQRIGEKVPTAEIYVNLANIHWKMENSEKAEQFFVKAHELRKEIGDPNFILITARNLVYFYKSEKKYDEALKYADIILDKTNTEDISYTEILTMIVEIYIAKGDLENARTYQEKAVNIVKNTDNKEKIGLHLIDLSIILTELKEYDQAIETANQALQIFEELKQQDKVAGIFYNIAEIYIYQNQTQKTIEFLEKSLQTREKIGQVDLAAELALIIANIYCENGQTQEASIFFEKALTLAKDSQFKTTIQEAKQKCN